MNAVLVAIVMLQSLDQGQVPLPPLVPSASAPEPVLPPLPLQSPQFEELMPVALQQTTKPPALVPVNPDARSSVPRGPTSQTDIKPPAFKLVDVPVRVDNGTANNAGSVAPAVESLPSGSVATPCLVLQRTAPSSVKAGQSFSYEIMVRNVGSLPAAQARLEELLPPGTRYSGSQPQALAQGDRLVWDLQNLGPGAERRIYVNVETAQAGAWKSQATLTVSISQALETKVAAAPLQMLTVSSPSSVAVGQPVTFVILLTNTTGAPLTDLVLGARLSPGLQHLQGDAIEGSLGELAPGKTREVTLDTVTTQAGRQTVEATVLSHNKEVAACQCAVAVTQPPALMLKLTAMPAASAGVQDFKLEVANRNATDVRDLVVTEMLPEGLDFVSADAGLYEPSTRKIRWSVGTLGVGQTCQVTFGAAVRSAEPQLNRISARASNGIEAQLHSIVRGGQ